MDHKEFVRYPELKSRFGIPFTFQHCSRLADDGKFPPKVKLSYHCVGWFVADIETWLADHRQTGAKAA